MSESSQEIYAVAASGEITISRHEDGHDVTDITVDDVVVNEQAIERIEETLGVSLEALAAGAAAERGRRNKATMGYSGRWNTSWDPHADKPGPILH